MHECTASPSITTVQAPHWPSPQPVLGAGQPELVAQNEKQRLRHVAHLDRAGAAVDAELDVGH